MPVLIPAAVGSGDGWGLADTGLVAVALLALTLTGALVAAAAPNHGGRVHAWRVFGRAPAGLAFCTAVLNAGMACFLIQGATRGALLQSGLGVMLGIAAATSSAALVIGWWVRKLHHWMHQGMWLSAVVWGGICTGQIAAGLEVSAWISGWLTAIFLYSWISEITDVGGETGAR